MESENIKALVTGGSSGIGRAIAKKIVDNSGKVVICARSRDTLQQTASEIDATPIQADVSSEAEVTQLVRQAIEELQGFNVLINNAGIGHFAQLTDLETEDFRKTLNINTVGAMMVARESAKHFIENNYGNILNISSTAGTKGFSGGSAYCASKFALGALTQCWRSELRQYNIRVMQLNPSEVQTRFSEESGGYNSSKLISGDIAQTVLSMLTLPDRGFIPETTVWATNPR